LKQLITTSYKPSPIANTQLKLFVNDTTPTKAKSRPKVTANKFIINAIGDIDGDGEFSLKDVALQLIKNKQNEWSPLDEDGDFRSDESISLLKQSDFVITNPPFSLFREYLKQLVDYDKKFLIIANINAITYKEVFPLIKENKIWLGTGMGRWISGFIVPESYELYVTEARINEDGKRIVATNNCLWLTNLDHGKRHQPLPLMTMADNKKYNKQIQNNKTSYKKYDNYDAIEVPYTNAIPSDYNGVMGVPITFLDKYNPEQFELLGIMNTGEENKGIRYKGTPHGRPVVNGVEKYLRILIKNRNL